MSRFLKLIVWVLLVVVPLQSAAAAAMLACGPSALVGEGDQAAQHAHHHPAEPQSLAHDHDKHEHHKEVAANTEEDSTPSNHEHGSTKCSACASCCVGGAAMMNSTTTVWAPPSTEARHFSGDSPVAGFFTDGPERPPRSLLA
ncbi:MAG TPA: hypothetical protein VJU83_12030 [Burkholderiales bacterium]|nr:hypothetical protein [Burkholderiales bacterium]